MSLSPEDKRHYLERCLGLASAKVCIDNENVWLGQCSKGACGGCSNSGGWFEHECTARRTDIQAWFNFTNSVLEGYAALCQKEVMQILDEMQNQFRFTADPELNPMFIPALDLLEFLNPRNRVSPVYMLNWNAYFKNFLLKYYHRRDTVEEGFNLPPLRKPYLLAEHWPRTYPHLYVKSKQLEDPMRTPERYIRRRSKIYNKSCTPAGGPYSPVSPAAAAVDSVKQKTQLATVLKLEEDESSSGLDEKPADKTGGWTPWSSVLVSSLQL
jgi:hypothetical protein